MSIEERIAKLGICGRVNQPDDQYYLATRRHRLASILLEVNPGLGVERAYEWVRYIDRYLTAL